MDEKIFELLSKLYNEVQDVKSHISKIEKKVDVISNQLTSFEDRVSNKLDALFDAELVNIDRDSEISTSIQRVEKKIESLELRVLKSDYRKTQIK